MKKKRGFTIIELVVVVVILAVLAAIAFVSYEKSRKQTRDARRVADLTNIESALRMYFLKNAVFPSELSSLSPDYFQTLPKTPTSPPGDYDYTNQTAYAGLHVTLEDGTNKPSTAYTTNMGTLVCGGDKDFCLKVSP